MYVRARTFLTKIDKTLARRNQSKTTLRKKSNEIRNFPKKNKQNRKIIAGHHRQTDQSNEIFDEFPFCFSFIAQSTNRLTSPHSAPTPKRLTKQNNSVVRGNNKKESEPRERKLPFLFGGFSLDASLY